MIREARTGSIPIPVFAPKRVQAITATEAWEPGADDRVFMSVHATTIQLQISGGTAFPLDPYIPLGIQPGKTYTSATTCSFLVE